jgi:Mce-associated membrane protein
MPPETITATTLADAENSQHVRDASRPGNVDEDARNDAASGSIQGLSTTRPATKRRISWSRVIAFGVLPCIVVMLAAAAGFLKWQDSSARAAVLAGIESVTAARQATVALLSYNADTAEQQLGRARDLLTGQFRDSYTSLINQVVIPGAREKHISAVATVPAVATVYAKPHHAVILLFINQTVTIGTGAPTDSTSSVRVTLDKVGDRWLISAFDPV